MFFEELRTAVETAAVKENLKIEESEVDFDNSLTITILTGGGKRIKRSKK